MKFELLYKDFYLFLSYMYGYFNGMCFVQYVYSWGHWSHKRSLDHLELGLWVVLSYHMNAGNKLGLLQEQQVP